MDVSIFLARVLAIYYIIISIALLCQAPRYKAVIGEMRDNQPLLFLAGVLALILGAMMVVAHNIWVAAWPVLITLIAWSALIKGIVIVMFPQFYQNKITKFLACDRSYHVGMIITLLLGIFLAYEGFYAGL